MSPPAIARITKQKSGTHEGPLDAERPHRRYRPGPLFAGPSSEPHHARVWAVLDGEGEEALAVYRPPRPRATVKVKLTVRRPPSTAPSCAGRRPNVGFISHRQSLLPRGGAGAGRLNLDLATLGRRPHAKGRIRLTLATACCHKAGSGHCLPPATGRELGWPDLADPRRPPPTESRGGQIRPPLASTSLRSPHRSRAACHPPTRTPRRSASPWGTGEGRAGDGHCLPCRQRGERRERGGGVLGVAGR